MKKLVVSGIVVLVVIGGLYITLSQVEKPSVEPPPMEEETVVQPSNEDAEDEFYEELISESGIYQGKTFWNPDSGSKEYQLMEGLVKRGRLKRSDMGGYQLK